MICFVCGKPGAGTPGAHAHCVNREYAKYASMDDLPNIPAENRFAFSADLAEIVWPDAPEGYEIRFARVTDPANDTFPLHPSSGRDWNPDAALTRVAGGDVAAFTARLHRAAEQYAQARDEHLSFEEMQDVVRGDEAVIAQHADHLGACEFCAGLRETLTTPAQEGYERASIVDTIAAVLAKDTDRWRCGVLLRWGSLWVGAHWSPKNRRLCVNLVPFVTLWVTAPGGAVP